MKFITFFGKAREIRESFKKYSQNIFAESKKHNFAPTSFDSRAFLVRPSLVRVKCKTFYIKKSVFRTMPSTSLTLRISHTVKLNALQKKLKRRLLENILCIKR